MAPSNSTEREDVLGPAYTARTIPLRPDDEGEVVATLVTRRAEKPNGMAVLHVHGFADYFFQTNAADYWCARGYDFHGLDLRKYGRSIRPHQTPTHVTDLTAYDEELDAALALVNAERDRVVLTAHSTGGLIVPLWLDRRRPPSVVGLVLNAPWLEMRDSVLMRTLGTAVIGRIGGWDPDRIIPRSVSGVYGRSLHRDHDGEWDFDLAWKPLESFPVRFGWLRAIRRGHAALHRGLEVGVPTLVLSSSRTGTEHNAGDERSTDVVLDVDQIRRWSPALGRHVTLAQVDGAIHDVTLSPQPARDAVFAELGRWLGAYVEDGRTAAR